MIRKFLVLLVLYSFLPSETFGASVARGQSRRYCGYKLKTGSGMNNFALMTYLYDHKDLTYTITKYSNKLSNSDVDNIIELAFKAWADVTDLKFTRIYRSSADVVVRFVVGDHGDGFPFDGRNGILAHAYYGFAHFDDSENWSASLTHFNSGSTNLYSVAVHEIGHVLGLDHSTIRRTMMYESYDPSHVVMRLHNDDINGIQTLYGSKTTRDEDDDSSVESGESDCWTTGCQPNSWAVVGCDQYDRTERSKTRCSAGYMYECCSSNSKRKAPRREPANNPNSGSWAECWTTGCQLNSWAVVGCTQYGMTEVGKFDCSGGNKYKCCK